MAWVRLLPLTKTRKTPLWAATVYTPAGRRTESHKLKGVVQKWADDLEADIRRGDFIDPLLARTLLDKVWADHSGSRRLEMASRTRDASIWKCWVQRRWGHVEVGGILKPDVQRWVNDLEADEVGGWTIIAALNVLKAVLELAVDAKMLRSNPARRVRPPMAPDHEDRVFEAEEEMLVLERLDLLFPGRRDARPFVETLFEAGGRWEEIAPVKREAFDLRNGLLALGPVMERNGTIRDYPKGARTRLAAGFRDVPLGNELLARLRPLVLATPPGGVVFTSPLGHNLRYTNWRKRVWVPTLQIPVVDERGRRVRDDEGRPRVTYLLPDPQPTPHDTRHTYGTRLADAGVEQHDRMALMGQKDQRSAQRYTHANVRRHDAARAALAAARGRPVPTQNSQVTHDLDQRSSK